MTDLFGTSQNILCILAFDDYPLWKSNINAFAKSAYSKEFLLIKSAIFAEFHFREFNCLTIVAPETAPHYHRRRHVSRECTLLVSSNEKKK